ncbi:hypothetical protein [Planktothrix mougeotii]|uniref:Uncharacterized protein n=1 Tax=Planktothrix mougeotii LEGE 06226 TaxID=1828728 RepID=A0ABR9UCZ1_9CYAN|nr:hypothetical protein [Planktothrix mougeotii]MBE9143989.1 hypothetical protein [Planktothrix mougeotii LEGE 06226]
MTKQKPSGQHDNFGKPPKSVMLPNLGGKNMQTLKPVKWTPIKLILFLIFVFGPYGALLYVASGISQVLLIYLLAIPTIAGLMFYIVYRLTKD